MELGKLPEHIRERAVKKHLTFKQPEHMEQAGHGRQNGFYSIGQQNIVTAQETVTGKDNMKLLLVRVLNDLWAAKAKPAGVSLSILLSQRMREIMLRKLVQEAAEYLEQYGVDLTAVDTQITDAVSEPVIVASAIGRAGDGPDSWSAARKQESPEQYSILCAGWSGASGMQFLGRHPKLEERFSNRYREEASEVYKDLTVRAAAEAVKDCSIYLQNASQTGIFGALWDLSESLDAGFSVEIDKLPLRQETIEYCEVFDKNPYLIPSDGALLVVTDTPGRAMEGLANAGIPVAMIGHLKGGNDKLLVSFDDGEREERFLDSPRGDELFDELFDASVERS